jgi:hypothetical protein
MVVPIRRAGDAGCVRQQKVLGRSVTILLAAEKELSLIRGRRSAELVSCSGL